MPVTESAAATAASTRGPASAAPAEWAARDPAAGRPPGRGDPGPQLPAAADPGRGRSCRRLAGPVPASPPPATRSVIVFAGRLLHGRDGQDPGPGPDRADPRAAGRAARWPTPSPPTSCGPGRPSTRAPPSWRTSTPAPRSRPSRTCAAPRRTRPRWWPAFRRTGRSCSCPTSSWGPRAAGDRPGEPADLDGRVPRARRDQPGRPAGQGGRAAGGGAVHPPGVRLHDGRAVAGGRG